MGEGLFHDLYMSRKSEVASMKGKWKGEDYRLQRAEEGSD